MPHNIIRNRDPRTIWLGIKDKDVLIKFRYIDWEIPQLIHLITIALELCSRVDEFRDDNVYCVYWGKEAAAIQLSFYQKTRFRWIAAASFPLVLP